MIGGTCKHSNVFSGPVLIARGLDFEHRLCRYGVLKVARRHCPQNPSQFPVVIAAGVHLFPFRTEQLSPPAPMVLGGQPPGRVGRRRIIFERAAECGPFSLWALREQRCGGRWGDHDDQYPTAWPPGRGQRPRLIGDQPRRAQLTPKVARLGRPQLLAPVRVEIPQPAHALRDPWMRDEHPRKALFGERVDRPQRLGGRARLERDQFARLFEPQ